MDIIPNQSQQKRTDLIHGGYSKRLTRGQHWRGAECNIYNCLVDQQSVYKSSLTTHTHTHTRLTALCPGLPGWAGTRKVKKIWILLKQETVSGSGISWAICKSAPRSRQITMPAPHHSVFLQAEWPSYHPTNSIKALKGFISSNHVSVNL